MTKVGSARKSTRKWIFVAERQGRLRPPRREVGLALDGVRGYFKITRLTSSWYLICSPFGLYAVTNYAGTVMGTRRRGISRSLRDVSDRAARAGLDWNATRLGLLPATYATCRCAMGDGPRPLRHRI